MFLQYGSHIIKDIVLPQQFVHGKWHGNDTIWRTILDINLILLYGNANGTLDINAQPRNILTIGDMIIAGENNGPLKPSSKPLGIILASNNCALFDYVFCQITHFDYHLIPAVKYAIANNLLLKDSLDKITMLSNMNDLHENPLYSISFPSEWRFNPNPAWKEVL
jgi:hypothetical protein